MDWLIVILLIWIDQKPGKSDETRCESKEKTAGMLMSNAMTSDCNLDSSWPSKSYSSHSSRFRHWSEVNFGKYYHISHQDPSWRVNWCKSNVHLQALKVVWSPTKTCPFNIWTFHQHYLDSLTSKKCMKNNNFKRETHTNTLQVTSNTEQTNTNKHWRKLQAPFSVTSSTTGASMSLMPCCTDPIHLGIEFAEFDSTLWLWLT